MAPHTCDELFLQGEAPNSHRPRLMLCHCVFVRPGRRGGSSASLLISVVYMRNSSQLRGKNLVDLTEIFWVPPTGLPGAGASRRRLLPDPAGDHGRGTAAADGSAALLAPRAPAPPPARCPPSPPGTTAAATGPDLGCRSTARPRAPGGWSRRNVPPSYERLTLAGTSGAAGPLSACRGQGTGAKPGSHFSRMARYGAFASSWDSTPIEPIVTRWISRYDGGRLSLRLSW